MKKYDFTKMSVSQIKKAIIELKAETEKIKKEAADIKKETEDIKKEAQAIKKETEDIIKRGKDLHLKNLAEIEALKKENEKLDIEYKAERKLINADFDNRLAILMEITGTTNSKLKGLDDNIGLGVEELFFESINKNKKIGNIQYDQCNQNFKISNNSNKFETLGEIDIMLVNGTQIALIEVKHRVSKKAILQILKNKQLFIDNFPESRNFNCNIYLAGLSLPNKIKEDMKKNNIGFIKIRGEHFELANL